MAKQPKRSKKPKASAGDKQPAEDVRENILRIRLTEAERQELDDAAKARALDTSSWARSLLLQEARRPQSSEGK